MSKPLQKVKILLLYEILKANTDEDHPLTTNELCDALVKMGVDCDRRTLAMDIDTLNLTDHEIMQVKKGRSYAYYVVDRLFNISEIKILIDAMHAAGFVSNQKSEALIGKLLQLCSKQQAELMKNNRVVFNQKKHNNEQVLYVIEAIEEALLKGKKISFKYFYLNENKEKIYRHHNDYYIENPISLIYVEDFYYLVAYNEKYDDIVHYRIDRMEYSEVIDESIHQKAIDFREHISEYTEQIFKMYGGEVVETTFRFKESIINPIYDRFGENIRITKVDDTWYQATFKVALSPTFFGWLHTFTDQIEIIGPEAVIEENIRRLQEHLAVYNK